MSLQPLQLLKQNFTWVQKYLHYYHMSGTNIIPAIVFFYIQVIVNIVTPLISKNENKRNNKLLTILAKYLSDNEKSNSLWENQILM